MGQGNGSAKPILVFGLAMLGLWAVVQPTFGAKFKVGEDGGWTFNVNSWPVNKSFQAGDILVFNYVNAWHNVVAVDKNGYENCTSPKGAKVYQSGKDEIKLTKGLHYFICSVVGHCQGGMKISVNVTS